MLSFSTGTLMTSRMVTSARVTSARVTSARVTSARVTSVRAASVRAASVLAASVLAASVLAASVSSLAAQGVPPAVAVRGIVFDSTVMRPLRGAQVQLVALPVTGRPRQSLSDSSGAFQFDSVAIGSYLIGFSHPRLDSLGLEPTLVRADLRAEGTIVAPLAVPSAPTLVKAACKVDISQDSTGILRGFARSARDGFPVASARLRLEWPEYVLGRSGMERTTRGIDAQANEAGAYRICGVPLETTVLANAYAGPDSSGVVELELPATGLLHRDLLLGASSSEHGMNVAPGGPVPPDATAAAATSQRATDDSSDRRPAVSLDSRTGAVGEPATALGPPRIRGTVRGADGAIVAGARIRLLGDDAEATSAEDGTFVLRDISSGTRMLDARAIGFQPGKVTVDVMGRGEALATLVLTPVASALPGGVAWLDTMRVSATSRLAETSRALRQDFARRMQSGVGLFVTDSAIRAKAPHLPSELFRAMPGVTVTNGSGGQGVYLRQSATFNASKGLCLPTVFLDGARAPRAVVDQLAIVSDMRAVEVYARGQSAPTQFQTSDGCGAIVIWTRTMWDAARIPSRPTRP